MFKRPQLTDERRRRAAVSANRTRNCTRASGVAAETKLAGPMQILPFDRPTMAPANISFASEKRTRRRTNVSVTIRFSSTTIPTKAPDCPSLWTRAKHRRSVLCQQPRQPRLRQMRSPPGTGGPRSNAVKFGYPHDLQFCAGLITAISLL